jgi:hypothetical protein
MGKENNQSKLTRISALLAGFVMLLCLTDCRGCREKREGIVKEEPAPVAVQQGTDRSAGRKKLPSRPPNALEKIAAAEKAGRIDLDQAWTYKMQALVDQGKLPEEYRSPERIRCGSPVLKGLAVVRARLKPETLASLRPYLVRPTDPASIFASRIPARVTRGLAPTAPGMLFAQEPNPPRPTGDLSMGNWVGVGCHSAPITVWSPIGQKAAEDAVAVIDGRKLWSEILKIMPEKPLSDMDAVDGEGKPDQGIDGDLDIYLVPASAIDQDGSAEGWCLRIGSEQRVPTWIMVAQDLSGKKLAATLSHELFHSFQCAIDQFEEIWWDEATATWAEEYIDSVWNTEHEFVPDAFDNGKFLLKTLNSEEGNHPYGAYIFPFYLAGRFKDAFIGQIWSDCSVKGPNALNAIEAKLSGARFEFKKAWKEFALMNYDDSKEYGRKYDETLDTFICHWEDRVVLTDKSQARSIELPPLSVFYFDVENRGIDPEKFPAVHFDLKQLEKESNVSVQAIIIKGGNYRVEDWTGQKEHDFCLKNEADRFTEIAVIVASAEREKTLKELSVPIELGYVTECDADWVGTFTYSATYSCSHATEGEWRKTGKWQAEVGATWQDQFTKNDYAYEHSFRATATLNLALKAQASKAESEDEKEMMESMNRLFGGAVYIQEGVKGFCQIHYYKKSKETTSIRPPGKAPFVLTNTTQASGGGSLTKYGMSLLSGPRLSVYPEKGEYTLDLDFSAPDVAGTSTVESSSGGSSSHAWTFAAKPLFGTYEWRANWAEPALKGKFSGDTIQGTWKSPPRRKSKDGSCEGAMLENAEITLNWSLRKVEH